jgi:DNA-binding IclR family transcriptional regulator
MKIPQERYGLTQNLTYNLQLLRLLRDHGSMAPAEIWEALGVSRQGAMDLLRPLLEAGLVEKVGGKKTGRYVLQNK